MLLSLLSTLLLCIFATFATASDLEARQTSACTLTVGDYQVPTNVTNGVPFPVKFCSSTYFKTSTNSIYFTWGYSNETNGAMPLVEMTPNVNNGYTFNATITYTQNTLNRNIYLGVLEKINDYYVPSSLHWYVKEAWISTP